MANTHPHKAAALADLQNGATPEDVAERYSVKLSTVRVWCTRWRKSGDLSSLGPVAPSITPSNVLPLPQNDARSRGKTRDPDVRAEKLRQYREEHARAKVQARIAALGPVDRASVRRIIRRLVSIQESGLWCPTCEPQAVLNRDEDGGPPQFNRLEPRDFLSMTRALHLNLEKLGPLLEVEGTLADDTQQEDTDYSSPEGMAELAASIVQIGPRLLCAVLQQDNKALKVVQAAVTAAERKTG